MLKKNFKRKNLSIKINKKVGFSKNFSSKIVDSFFNILTTELSKSNQKVWAEKFYIPES